MKIEELKLFPNHNRTEDGYAYDEKYVDKIFRYNDNYYYFKQKSYIEIPVKLVEFFQQYIEEYVTQAIEERITDYNHKISAKIELITEKLDTLTENVTNQFHYFSDRFEKLDKININTDNNQQIEKLKENLNKVFSEFDSKIKLLQEDLQSLNSKIQELPNNNPSNPSKLKISTLVTLKEMGFSPSEISDLAKNNLI